LFHKLCMTALVAGLLTASPVAAADFLGERIVSYGSETDVIQVPGTKRYKSIRLCVKQHAVRFRDLDVVFANGGKQDIAVKQVVAKGKCTRWINLRGPKRDIRRIVLRYDTFGNSGPRALVMSYGK